MRAMLVVVLLELEELPLEITSRWSEVEVLRTLRLADPELLQVPEVQVLPDSGRFQEDAVSVHLSPRTRA